MWYTDLQPSPAEIVDLSSYDPVLMLPQFSDFCLCSLLIQSSVLFGIELKIDWLVKGLAWLIRGLAYEWNSEIAKIQWIIS